MTTKFLVIRSGRALSAPGGGLPGEEVLDHMAMIRVLELVGHPNLKIVVASTGDPPDGYEWVSVASLQRELPDEESHAVGEALLCA